MKWSEEAREELKRVEEMRKDLTIRMMMKRAVAEMLNDSPIPTDALRDEANALELRLARVEEWHRELMAMMAIFGD
jgi:hypothetical protein